MDAVTVKTVSKLFGNTQVLNRVSASFRMPERCCLMGPSGSGKTTLFRILLGLEQPSSGAVEGMEGLRLSAVFQEDRLCESFSAVQNLLMVLGRNTSAETAVKELSLLLPQDCLDRPVSTLSGGMKRRVAICRSLIVPSDFVIMDEPLTGLDEKTKEITAQYIKTRTENRILLFSTHQEEDISLLKARLITLS